MVGKNWKSTLYSHAKKQVHGLAWQDLAGIALLCLMLPLVGCSRGNERSYATLADADKAGEITRRWIPDFVPQSSRNIRIIGGVSPTFEYCAFDFSPADSRNFKNAITPVDSLPEWARQVRDPRVRWWPSVLAGRLDVPAIRNAGFEIYTHSELETVGGTGTVSYLFAIDWARGRVFFYSTLS